MPDKKPNRKRDIHFHFCVNEEDEELIRHRMVDTGVISLGAYFRKMTINGYYIKIDLTDVREMTSLLRRKFKQLEPNFQAC